MTQLLFVAVINAVFVANCGIIMAEDDGNNPPYLRSAAARTLYAKMLIDERLRRMDWRQEYQLTAPPPPAARRLFVQLAPDADSTAFVAACHAQGDRVVATLLTEVARALLGVVLCQTSVNGLLNRGRMFVWSREQAAVLLSPVEPTTEEQEDNNAAVHSHGHQGEQENRQTVCSANSLLSVHQQEVNECPVAPVQQTCDDEQFFDAVEQEPTARAPEVPWARARVLDVGAGDGHVTDVLAREAREVTCTEVSYVMRARLRARGYRVLDAHDWPGNDDGTYDVVTVLNVVDRHPAPRTLLRDVGEKLAPGGRLVLAAVLPFSPYVEYDSSDHLPKESLNISGVSFEEQATSIITEVLPSLGYKVERWTKLPYMCEGDATQSIYWLNDALFVARKL